MLRSLVGSEMCIRDRSFRRRQMRDGWTSSPTNAILLACVMSASSRRQMSVLPTHIADWAGIIMPPDQWNDTNGAGGWLLDAGGQLCPGNGSDTAATVGHAMSTNVYTRRRVFINVYLVVGLPCRRPVRVRLRRQRTHRRRTATRQGRHDRFFTYGRLRDVTQTLSTAHCPLMYYLSKRSLHETLTAAIDSDEWPNRPIKVNCHLLAEMSL